MPNYSKEKMRKYMRDYVKNSEQCKCPCGGHYKSYNKYIHDKSKKHIKYIENMENKTEDGIHKELKEYIKEVIDNHMKNYTSLHLPSIST